MLSPEAPSVTSEKTAGSFLRRAGTRLTGVLPHVRWLGPSFAALRLIASDFLNGLRWVALKTAGIGGMLVLLLLLTVWQSTSLRAHLSDLVWLPDNLRPAQWPIVLSAQSWLDEQREAFYRWPLVRGWIKSEVSSNIALPSNTTIKNAVGPANATVDSAGNKVAPLSETVQKQRRAEAVGKYLSRRYRISREATEALVDSAFRIGEEMQLDPLMLLAVMAIESGFNPFAQSWMGAQGLMQVMTGVHTEKFQIFGGERAAWNPLANMRVGARILKDCVTRGGSVAAGLKLYVGAGGLDNDQGYGVRVLAELRRLHDVAAGRVVPVNPLPPPVKLSGSSAEKTSIDSLEQETSGGEVNTELEVAPSELSEPSNRKVMPGNTSEAGATRFDQG